MKNWEYCSIAPIKVVDGAYKDTRLVRFTLDGVLNVPVVEVARTHNVEDAIAITIAKLGEDGWEMVGCGNLDTTMHSIYFKRLKDN
jgi:hypothetical protein